MKAIGIVMAILFTAAIAACGGSGSLQKSGGGSGSPHKSYSSVAIAHSLSRSADLVSTSTAMVNDPAGLGVWPGGVVSDAADWIVARFGSTVTKKGADSIHYNIGNQLEIAIETSPSDAEQLVNEAKLEDPILYVVTESVGTSCTGGPTRPRPKSRQR